MADENPFQSSLEGPVGFFALGLEMAHLASETQTVVAMRLLGMSGMWNVKPTENTRMVAEKPAAFSRSAAAAMQTALAGGRPDEIMSAAVEPLRAKTRSNVARLSQRGPGLPR